MGIDLPDGIALTPGEERANPWAPVQYFSNSQSPRLPRGLTRHDDANVILTQVNKLVDWGRSSSLWPALFGLACCAIEMMASGAPRYDIDRFGAGAFRATPRQADLMIVAGTVNFKMASRVRRLYNQMPDPKFVIAMGACTCGGGPYYKYGYNVVKGVDLVVPVDVYVPGCPPRPEALLEGLMRIQDKVKAMQEYTKGQPLELPMPARTGAVLLPDEISTPEKAADFAMKNKERAKPAKA